MPSVAKARALAEGFTDSVAALTPQTHATATGRVQIAAGASAFVINNVLCRADSVVVAQLESISDGTLTRIQVVPTAGVITITGNAAATGAVGVRYIIMGKGPV